MANPRLGTHPASMLICGDDSEAKTVVKQLSDELGFETVDVGPLALARLLEPYGMLWIQMSFGLVGDQTSRSTSSSGKAIEGRTGC